MKQNTSPAINSTSAHNGMTLLQYYAGQALAGMCSNLHNATMTMPDLCGECFTHAESMLAEYNKRYGADAEIGKTK